MSPVDMASIRKKHRDKERRQLSGLPDYSKYIIPETVTETPEGEACSIIDSNRNESIDGLLGHPKFLVIWSNDTSRCTCECLGKYKTKGHVDLHPAVKLFFDDYVNSCFSQLPVQRRPSTVTIPCYTEYGRDTIGFRAHPNYHSRGPWYDWSKIVWNDAGINTLVPGKILSFFELPWELSEEFLEINTNTAQDPFLMKPENYVPQAMAVVHSCHSCPTQDYSTTSRIFQTWRLEYKPVAMTKCPSAYVVHDPRRNPDTPFTQFEYFDETTPPSTTMAKQQKNVHYRQIQLRPVPVACLDTNVLVIEEEPGIREAFTSDKDYLSFKIDPLVLVCRERHSQKCVEDGSRVNNPNMSDTDSIIDVPDSEPTWVDEFLSFGKNV